SSFGLVLFISSLVWILYIALEPHVRRRLPHILISWTRVISGQIKDPLVGRDVLIGCAAALVVNVIRLSSQFLPKIFGYPEPLPLLYVVFPGLDRPLTLVLSSMPQWALGNAIAALFFYFLFRSVFRKENLAAAILIVMIAIPTALVSGPFWLF